jgi:hypothetical protein
VPRGDDHIDLEANELGGNAGPPLGPAVGPAILNRDIAALDPPELV